MNNVFTQSIVNEDGEVQLRNISWLDVENDEDTFVYECPVCKSKEDFKGKRNILEINRDASGFKGTEFKCDYCNYMLTKSERETNEWFNGYKFRWNNKYDKYNCVDDCFSIHDDKISLKQVGYIQAFFSHRKECLTMSRVDHKHGYDISENTYLSFELI